ncbi:MAG: methionine biosynthesis protein MetW [Spirochaetia bacterium]|nr:methionine biosynthesis protein MetW [Spirochaetia bacterium]
MNTPNTEISIDYKIILDIIPEKSSVLDLGCGTGELLLLLSNEKKIKGQGVEIDENAIYECVEKGLNVFSGDLDSGLEDYADKSFDYVILNQCIQQVIKPVTVLDDALRVGKKVIVGIPNFANYKIRFQLFFMGKKPITKWLPYEWFETPNLHYLSVYDFFDYCKGRKIKIEKTFYMGAVRKVNILPNFFSQNAIFIISRD